MRWLVRQIGPFFDSPRAAAAARLGLATAALTTIAMALVKIASIRAVAASEIGRRQLDGELGLWNALGWFAPDLWAALLWGMLIGVVFGLASGRRARLAAGMLLVVTNLMLAAALIVGLVVYQLFGASPTLQLLRSLDQAGDATDSAAALLSGGIIAFAAVLAVLLAILPLILSRLMARWPRTAAAVAVFLAAAAALGLAGEIAGDRSRFELDRNPITGFARSAIFGTTVEDEVGYVPPSKFHEVLRPVAPPARQRVDGSAYERLSELGKRQPNVVLVMMESTSPLHMSHTNPEAGTTPFMAELAGKSLFWPRHYAHTPKSIFAIYQVLCSTLTELHGRQPTETRPRIDCRSMSEILGEHGYVSGMFHSGHFRYSQKDLFFGDRGYQVLYDAHSLPNADKYYEWSWGIEEAAAIDAMVQWADTNRESPFFITYIPVYPHHPYHTPYPVESHTKSRAGHDLENYHKAIRYVDDMMRKLITDFRDRGLLENTLFVITGDHGEGFGEHPGSRAHGSRLYDEQARTFTLWYADGLFAEQAIDNRTFGHIDLLPTLLDVLGIPRETRHRGLSALEPRRRPMVPLYTAHGIPFTGFVDGAMKYIYNGRARRSELYDLELDPGERDNLAAQFPDTVATYRQRAGELASVAKEWWNEVPDIPERGVDPEALAAGEEREWVMRPVECQYNPEQLFAESGVLRAHGNGRAFCYSGELPPGDLVVTDFRLNGREDIAASVILALLGWINEAGERQQIAYCKLNGNAGNPATTCEPTMIPGGQRLAGGKGKLLTVIRYRTPASDPDPQRFSVDEVRVTYRVLEK